MAASAQTQACDCDVYILKTNGDVDSEADGKMACCCLTWQKDKETNWDSLIICKQMTSNILDTDTSLVSKVLHLPSITSVIRHICEKEAPLHQAWTTSIMWGLNDST